MSRLNLTVVVLILNLVFCAFCAEPTVCEIGALVENLGNHRLRVRERAMLQLIKIGKPAVPALRAALLSDEPEVNMHARQALLAIQTEVEYWVDELNSGDMKARGEALAALSALGEKAKPAIPELVKLLDAKDDGRPEPEDEDDITALKRKLRLLEFRNEVIMALISIDPEYQLLEDGTIVPAKSHCNGRYAKLLRTIHVPQDLAKYGEVYEFGLGVTKNWQGHENIPPGLWVYVYPHWYIWGERKCAAGTPLLPGVSPREALRGRRNLAPALFPPPPDGK